ncbi:MAG: hypothetical protein ACFCU4_07440 [Puniceicoccaceae bacterium]
MSSLKRFGRVIFGLSLAGLIPGFASAQPTEAGASMADERLLAIAQVEQNLRRDAADQGTMSVETLLLRSQEVAGLYENFVSDNPDHLYGRILAGKFYNAIGRSREAASQLLEAIRIDPSPAVIHQQLGNALVGDGRPLEALPFLLGAIEREPTVPDYHYGLGVYLYTFRELLLEEKVIEGAVLERQMLEAFAEAHRLAPESLDYAVRFGEAFYDLAEPQWDAALEHWRKLVRGAENEVLEQVFLLHQAKVLYELGRRAEAIEVLERIKLRSLAESVAALRNQIEAGTVE